MQVVPAEPIYAGFGLRLVAWMLDWVILMALRIIVLMISGMVALAVEGAGLESERVARTGGLVILAMLYLCAWPYYAVMEASRLQGTVGKLAAGIRVEDIEGGRATFLQTTVRFFLRLVSGLLLGFGFLMIAFTRRRQALHDMGANTIVTRKPVARWPVRPGHTAPSAGPPEAVPSRS